MEKERDSNQGPLLSVVVVTVYNTGYLANCLHALHNQVDTPRTEVIAVYDDRIKDVNPLKKQYPWVRFIHVRGRRRQESLRAAGVRSAHGEIIALTVDHCTPEEDWCAVIYKAHLNSSAAAIGGVIEKGTQPGTAINWAVHLYDYCNYGYYQRPVLSGPAYDLSDCNVSYKQSAISEVVDAWRESFQVTMVNKVLVNQGKTLWLLPDMVVYQHRNISIKRAFQIAFRRGRLFSTERVGGYTLSKRLLYIAASPLLPLVLLGRFLKNIVLKRLYFPKAIQVFPLIIVLSILWSSGEFVGYLTGRMNKVLLDVD